MNGDFIAALDPRTHRCCRAVKAAYAAVSYGFAIVVRYAVTPKIHRQILLYEREGTRENSSVRSGARAAGGQNAFVCPPLSGCLFSPAFTGARKQAPEAVFFIDRRSPAW